MGVVLAAGLLYVCGFNGATAVRPWMALRPTAAATRSRRFNGATAVRPWMGDEAAERGTEVRGLQWGHGREAMDGAAIGGTSGII